MRIALAGNPNSGKTTLFNSLTGSNQRVGNWPGVTVEQKYGHVKKNKAVEVIDLPGIYSLSPYTTEEEIARNYLLEEKPDAIINIIDGTNLERNLYLTTQLLDLNIPLVLAVNMADILEKTGDIINLEKLSKDLSIPVVLISALKGSGLEQLTEVTIKTSEKKSRTSQNYIKFNDNLEVILEKIDEIALKDVEPNLKRWYQVKLFERDTEMQTRLNLGQAELEKIDKLISDYEDLVDDDSESIITSSRYQAINGIIKNSFEKSDKSKLSTSDKIDQIVTNRILALPIFVAVMFLVYFISISTVGTWATDWVNESAFGDGWFLLGQGRSNYDEAAGEYDTAQTMIEAFETEANQAGLAIAETETLTTTAEIFDDEGNLEEEITVNKAAYSAALSVEEPQPAAYGTWIPGIPVLLDDGLKQINVSPWLNELVIDGIVAGVGAVLGFLPQIFVLFLCLAFLEACGYMARIAFIMDRIFRKFGLSGKSFIPLMIGTGCSVPGIMAARTIENERDRRMTVMTTSFVPCGAKLPVIALIAGAFFGGKWWVGAAAYFIGILAVVVSGIILKKTKRFAGEVASFVIELPSYHLPRLRDVLRNSQSRTWSFVKRAGSIVLLSTIVIWFLSNYGFESGFGKVANVNNSILASIGSIIGWIFAPLGFGGWRPAVATITGLVAKENIVGTFGVLYNFGGVAENGWQIWENMHVDFTALAAFSFLVFNLLCAPCFAAIGAIKREMGDAGWTAFAIGYQTFFAYTISLIVYQFGLLALGTPNILGITVAGGLTIAYLYLLFRPGYNKKMKKSSVSFSEV